ncbi:MAG: peptidylprolyl isomerase [Balneola sp.]
MKKLSLLLLLISLSLSCAQSEKEEVQTTDEIAIISTDFGEIYVALYDETPLHKQNFLKLAKEGFYDSTTFHRIIEEFMIQGGDPNSKDEIPFNDGQGGPGYTIYAEFNTKFIHKKGALGAARLGDQQNPQKKSSGSQFYIVQGRPVSSLELDQVLANINNSAVQGLIREYCFLPENAGILESLQRNQAAGRLDSVQAIINRIEPIATEGYIPKTYSQEQRDTYATLGGTPFLDWNYTVFGEVIKGLAIVDSIAVQQKGPSDRPLENIIMTVRIEEMQREKITTEFGYSYN